MHLAELLKQSLWLDLETTRSGRIRHIGAILDKTVFEKKSRAYSKETLAALDDLANMADFILGHNLLGHDFPILKEAYPGLKLLQKPVIDTLFLSPLAFPANPYHRLIKDYKLVRSSINDPVADARLSASVFNDQWKRFESFKDAEPLKLEFFRFCFEDSLFNGFGGDGLAAVFKSLGADKPISSKTATDFFLESTMDLVCPDAALKALPPILDDKIRRPMAAYALAWLQVSGSNSVLPPWVRHSFPKVSSLLKTLRSDSCAKSECPYCKENHNPDIHLKRFFGFDSFREKPANDEGKSLQRDVVATGMNETSLLAILPTGGGKSLCYQLPALIRHFRQGLLTVVISPLQALMKDQVDNLSKNTGTPFAEAVYGLLTPPERGAVLERVRLGDVAILYIAPEQLRSPSVKNVLKQREIGCWVFDEAHCISKWGHDFRPDYLYATRFIREFANETGQPVPPVCCYTATAKEDVIDELEKHFKAELDQNLTPFAGGVERENLAFDVFSVTSAEKLEQTFQLVENVLSGDHSASIVIYAATRKKTEEIREYLRHQGIAIEAFHGGLEPKEKRDIIEAFVEGEIPVISATNAFGMGVDKGNIRLVIHFDMPGSLENYIQEAGRAGRDRQPARCILLYDPASANTQFSLGALSEVRQREIQRILKALRNVKGDKTGEIVITSDELLRDEELSDLSEKRAETRDTKVKTAVAWLERSGILQRNQNLIDLFQGRPLVKSLQEAEQKLEALRLEPATKKLWLNILAVIFNYTDEKGISADHIAEQVFRDKAQLRQLEQTTHRRPAQIVINALHEMAEKEILDRGLMLSALLRLKIAKSSRKTLESITTIENKMLSIMRIEAPDADSGQVVSLSVSRLCQRLKNEGFDTSPHVIRDLIKGISYDGKGLAASAGSIELRHVSRDRYNVRLQRTWDSILKIISIRQNVAYAILEELTRIAEKKLKESGTTKGEVHLSFSSNDLSRAIGNDIALRAQLKKNKLPAIDRALLYLHEHKVIHLQGGLAVLRQAMTIRLLPEAKGRKYAAGDFKPLLTHYAERRLQVHVMVEYAQLGLKEIADALTLVLDYFSLKRLKFINKYFSDRKELIKKATTQEMYRKVVDQLGNPVQISAVGNKPEANMLILAGPGSGKTRVIVHRCAYLLQVERVPARQILVLCFNHNAAVTLRKRLNNLVGSQAKGVMVTTYHGAAMRIAGISVRDLMTSEKHEEIDFNRLIKDALALISGQKELPGVEEPEELKERLLGGFSHILVDEYQDIDQDQYDLVAAIAGKSEEEIEGKLSILAVGDDDQNIYSFRKANVRFIKQFKVDYTAGITYLVENYRSSKHIIAAANQLIRNNQDRMKKGYPIRINRDRETFDPGGKWTRFDPISKGRVQMITVKDIYHQALGVMAELDRLKNLTTDFKLERCAILARSKSVLAPVRSILEQKGYPVKIMLERSFPVQRVREVVHFIDFLQEKKASNYKASGLISMYNDFTGRQNGNVWNQLLLDFLENYAMETADAELPLDWAVDSFFEYLVEQRREKSIGQGIFLGTIHSAKGMEFSHVFILDGDWNMSRTQAEEEERRVFYVAMTRAKKTLVLMRTLERENPFLKELTGNSILRRASNISPKIVQQHHFFKHQILGLDDIYMDYAGTFQNHCRIHKHISRLTPGSQVRLMLKNGRIEIYDQNNCCVGRLSGKSVEKWQDQLKQIQAVRVIAMLCRNKTDPDEAFQKLIKTNCWELPVLEVVSA